MEKKSYDIWNGDTNFPGVPYPVTPASNLCADSGQHATASDPAWPICVLHERMGANFRGLSAADNLTASKALRHWTATRDCGWHHRAGDLSRGSKRTKEEEEDRPSHLQHI